MWVQANLPMLRQTRAFEDETNAATTRPLYIDLCPLESCPLESRVLENIIAREIQGDEIVIVAAGLGAVRLVSVDDGRRRQSADEAEARLNSQSHRFGTLTDSADIIRKERWELG